MQKMESRKITSGTKEWADSNINIYSGCSNNCRYCYAKKMAIRFGRKTEANWNEMESNLSAIVKNYKKRNGRIMFPTSHDITPKSLFYCLLVLEKLLKAKNEILITSKPDPGCIIEIINSLERYKRLIQFRFTITSLSYRKLRFWEPNAPNFSDRMNSLLLAFTKGYKTSVSIEPYLDSDPTKLILKVAPYCTESIWLGKMNYIKKNNLTQEEKLYYSGIREITSWSHIQKIVEKIKLLPEDVKSKIRIKDSIVRMYKKHGIEVKI